MKPSELDKANGDYEEWKPEVGQECEHSWNSCRAWYDCIYHGTTLTGKHIVECTSNGVVNANAELYFRPIQTQADKYRDDQLEQIRKQLIKLNHVDPKVTATRLYSMAGVRILADNEFIGRELMDEQKDAICDKVSSYELDLSGIIEAVQKAIKGEA